MKPHHNNYYLSYQKHYLYRTQHDIQATFLNPTCQVTIVISLVNVYHSELRKLALQDSSNLMKFKLERKMHKWK